jgi:hypothetical protein
MKLEEIRDHLRNAYGGNLRQDDPHRWRIEVFTSRSRSQVVHLMCKERRHAEDEESRVIAESPIGPVLRRFNPEIVLRKNAGLDVGAICINDLKNEEQMVIPYLTLRASHLMATLDIPELEELISKVAHVADELEEEIFGKDFH